jgi:uncharacterized protein Yka (UPF0111/DUF47 family)
MTPEELGERLLAIRRQIPPLREQLKAALVAMDYTQALAFQMEIDALERDADLLEHQARRRIAGRNRRHE